MAQLIDLGGGRFRVDGDLNLSTVVPLVGAGARVLNARGNVEARVDLSGVGQSSSAGVALLLEWQGQARRAGRRLRFENCPPSMVRIADFSNLEALLDLREDAA